ncbi:MAG: RNA polymerase sigma-70 factor [Bacteroidia bacterium]|nr:RNA polymerase sigma-70 factor [Bacteroidia bacterium]
MFKETDTKNLDQQFEKFFTLYFPKVKNFAAMLLKSDFEAEDIAQDIFMKLWNAPDLWINDYKSAEGYLYAMTKNQILDLIKHKKVERAYRDEKIEDYMLSGDLDNQNPLDTLYYEEVKLLILLALEQMPEKRKQVFTMSRFEKMSNQEIADQLNLSVRTVEHHIYLALSDLKKIIIYSLFFIFF